MGAVLIGEGASRVLNSLAREQLKLRLLADINLDLAVCEIEGWDAREYLADLHQLIAQFSPCRTRPS